MHPTLPIHRFSARTIPALLLESTRRAPAHPFLRVLPPDDPKAPPVDVTFAAFQDGVARAAAFLRARGVGAGDRVLLLAENSAAWQQVAIATQLLRAEPAALFASLSAEPARGIARRVSPKVVLVSGAAQWDKLAPIAVELASAGLVAVVTAKGPVDVPAGLEAVTVEAALGASAPTLPPGELERLAAAVGQEDPYLLLFTSGTTGRPKGVRLPQRAIVHAIDGGGPPTGTSDRDVGLHFLPFGHVAGHDQFTLALAQGHTLLLAARREDIERGLSYGPTYLFSVPLVYDRIRAAVEAKLGKLPGPLSRLARAALAAAARVRVDGSRSARDRALTGIADRLVGRAVKARLGGNVRGLFSGGAPAGEALFRFFESLGVPYVEMYGMSETAGLISSNLWSAERRSSRAGFVSPDHQLRIAPDGELQLRGPLLLSGYLEPEDNEGAFTADGWFCTGDLARVHADGSLEIQGRKKHLMVLSTGKKLSPEPIEQAIASAAPFEGAVLIGEGRPFVAAAVFVAKEELARLAAAGKDAAEELLPRARAALAAFSEYEKPKKLVVIPGSPQDHPSLVTPTLKLRRDVVMAELAGPVTRLYGAA